MCDITHCSSSVTLRFSGLAPHEATAKGEKLMGRAVGVWLALQDDVERQQSEVMCHVVRHGEDVRSIAGDQPGCRDGWASLMQLKREGVIEKVVIARGVEPPWDVEFAEVDQAGVERPERLR